MKRIDENTTGATEDRIAEIRARWDTETSTPSSERKALQVVFSARQMFLARIAKYDDPRNEEWDWDDVTDKWERHAFAAFRDLLTAESDLHAALSIIDAQTADAESVRAAERERIEEAVKVVAMRIDPPASVPAPILVCPECKNSFPFHSLRCSLDKKFGELRELPPERIWIQRSPDGSFDNRFIWTKGDIEYVRADLVVNCQKCGTVVQLFPSTPKGSKG